MSGFDVSALIGSGATVLPTGLLLALPQVAHLKSVESVSDWALLSGAIERRRPGLLILDRSLWRSASAGPLIRLPVASADMRIVTFCEAVDVAMIGEAINYGVHGCMATASTSSQWVNALEVVLRGDVAMPRNLLALALEKALHPRVNEPHSPLPAPVDAEALTERERDVIHCVTSGMSNKEIARHLGISNSTVKTHLHHVFGKLKVGRRLLLMPGTGLPH